MLSAKVIQSMKQNNISGDIEATKERVKAVLKEASRQQMKEIDKLAGLKRVSIYRVYNTGSISAKVAVAIAHEDFVYGDILDSPRALVCIGGKAGLGENTEY